ncbi:MAG TPA: signal peptidase II [Deltaproteobacteria bacterium]|nr:MAG: signal peptidase II [Deltaproteobacteria bacterium GWA2_55_82]OGQ65017.1 MAG: signal peptidase II [Deltaproteobacteria bacterium RIFCSPLOWO2_02_FULL_55_12]OIJ73795.1 MAG: signal peptidase II [Deltaproteobacteria bacterium GWC2_55_46]HBG45802.1 signal peptidase II [Deltaproteobacteria bacterium]HCY09779.1 signal peptidase II [Deltaproteobacteria bacterium]
MRGGTGISVHWKIFAATVLTVAALDQATKLIITQSLPVYSGVEVVPGFFSIVHYLNKGAAFGILNDGGAAKKLFLIGVSLVSLAIVTFLIRQSTSRLHSFAFSLIAGGAVGNLIDRVRFGSVVDFLDFYLYTRHWPAFNVADSAITAGVAIALFSYLFGNEKSGEENI